MIENAVAKLLCRKWVEPINRALPFAAPIEQGPTVLWPTPPPHIEEPTELREYVPMDDPEQWDAHFYKAATRIWGMMLIAAATIFGIAIGQFVSTLW